MNCCGKKRQALAASWTPRNQETNESAGKGSTSPVESNDRQTTARFRYTGSGSLEVDSIFGRRVYRFSAGVPELGIVPEDVAVMRGYSELIELKQKEVTTI